MKRWHFNNMTFLMSSKYVSAFCVKWPQPGAWSLIPGPTAPPLPVCPGGRPGQLPRRIPAVESDGAHPWPRLYLRLGPWSSASDPVITYGREDRGVRLLLFCQPDSWGSDLRPTRGRLHLIRDKMDVMGAEVLETRLWETLGLWSLVCASLFAVEGAAGAVTQL